MTKTLESQTLWTDEHLKYLDVLRETGVVNMFGAVPYLEATFDLNKADAKEILFHWMDIFGERHKAKRLAADLKAIEKDEIEATAHGEVAVAAKLHKLANEIRSQLKAEEGS